MLPVGWRGTQGGHGGITGVLDAGGRALCSRGRSGAGELEALHVGLRMCTICESTAPKVSEKKRESRERNFVCDIN